jgi:asparagine synthase (glutamine-hydrolysing)
MCGICGKLFFDRERVVDDLILREMMNVMRHRGPDDEGIYISGPVGLGHRRLSIIDLNTGKQPICNETGTVWIVFNGEIYNYLELRKHLSQKGHAFKTETDTEVIVHLYEEYGQRCVAKLRGMFAFAIWDGSAETLFLARDRVGIKPLYYVVKDDGIVFGSEMKAILSDPSVPRNINLPIIDRFLSYYYVPGDETLLHGISKLAPGHYLTAGNREVDIQAYWNLKSAFSSPTLNRSEAKEEVLSRLREAVRIHMVSDVPVGFLLSGGVDSTALLSLAIQETDKDISTFTLGFAGRGFADERKYARIAARAFGTRHYDLTITSADFGDFLPKYVWHMEEPVCEPPAVALYYVSKLASEHVKVLISGEGGDEAFAGYQTYRNLVWLERLKKSIGRFNGTLSGLLNGIGRLTGLGRFAKYVPFLSTPLEEYYYSRTSSPFTPFNTQYRELYTPEFLRVVDKGFSAEPTRAFLKDMKSAGNLAKMLYTDTKTWLPDDLLVKADKITMANSVELRVPFLDHKILEFAAGLPSSMKLRGVTTKYILKRAFAKIVPQEILDRKKTGFPVPYGAWMKGELRSFVEDVVLSPTAQSRGYFNKEGIEKMLSAHMSKGSYPKEVFSLAVLELWHRAFVDRHGDL